MRRGGRFVVCSTWDRMSKNHGLGRGGLHGFHCVLLCRSAVCKSAYCIVAATFNIMQCAASCDVMLLVMSVMKTLLHVTMDWNTPSPPTLPPTWPIHTLTKEINKGHIVLYLSAAANKPCSTVVMLSGSCNWQWAVMVMVLLNTMQWQSCFTILPYNQMSLKSLAVGRCPAPDFCTGKL